MSSRSSVDSDEYAEANKTLQKRIKDLGDDFQFFQAEFEILDEVDEV